MVAYASHGCNPTPPPNFNHDLIHVFSLDILPHKSAYKCYDPINDRLYHSRRVQFIENEFPSQIELTKPLPKPDEFLIPCTSSPHPHLIRVLTSTSPESTTTDDTTIIPPNPISPSPQPTSPLPSNSPETSPPTTSPSQHSTQTPPSPSTASNTPSSTHPATSTSYPNSQLVRTRKRNSKYFNDSFINTTTLHPIPATIEL